MRAARIPFGPWRPQFPQFDSPGLAEAKNVLPIFGGYRLLRKHPDVEENSDWGAPDVDSVITHLLSENRDEEGIRPNGDGTNAGGWATVDEEDSDGNDLPLWDALNEQQASTSDYIQVLGAPSSASCILEFEDPNESPDTNLAANEVNIRMQYRIQGSSG